DSRIHTDFYELAHQCLRNVSNIDSDQDHFLMQLINREINSPFGDNRLDYKIPTIDQVFSMITKMTNDSLHQNLIVSVVVDHITTDGIKVSLKNSTIKCKVGWN